MKKRGVHIKPNHTATGKTTGLFFAPKFCIAAEVSHTAAGGADWEY